MQLRSFIFMGFCAVFGMSSAAFAGTPAMTSPQAVGNTAVINVAAKSDAAQLKLLKKKKNPSPDDLAQISKLEDKIIASCIIGTLMREGKTVHYINLTNRKGQYTGKIKTGTHDALLDYLIRNKYVR